MKKQTLRTMLLTLVAMVWVGAAQAQNNYKLWIAGVQVTSANCNNLSDIPGVTGTVKYIPATKTLTLQDATIRTTAEKGGGIGIVNDISGLSIKLMGNSTIIAEKSAGIHNKEYRDLTFKGEGKLVVQGTTTGNIYYQIGIWNQGSITVSECTVEASSGACGLAEGSWKFDHCIVRAKGGKNSPNEYVGSIGNIEAMPEFTGCAITAPRETYWKAYKVGSETYYSLFGEDDKVVTDWVEIASGYGFWIAGMQVTSANCNNLSDIPGVITGTVQYDPTGKTLTLQDATIHAEEREGIENAIDGLTIRLLGNNTIISEKNNGIYNREKKSLILEGDGKLVVKGATTGIPVGQCAILNFGSIIVSGCTIEASAGECGLASGHWKFDRCTVRAKGGGSKDDEYAGSISKMWYEKPEFVGCAITSPKGTYWKDFKVGGTTYYSLFGKEDKAVTDWVTIASGYDLQVAGVQVNSANYGDLAADNPNVTGTVQYDPTAKTLTLQDATIKAESKFAIESGIEGLKVKVVGTSKLTSENYTTLSFAKPATITGGGTLNVESSNDCAIYANKTSLTIENCTVHATAPQHGIAGFNGASGEILTIRNATVTAEGTGEGSIHDFANVILEGCAITQPAGAAFNKSLHGIALNGQLVKSKVVITKGGTSIEGVTPNVPQKKRGIYNLEGIRLSGEWKDLPAGIYIVDGEKRIKE